MGAQQGAALVEQVVYMIKLWWLVHIKYVLILVLAHVLGFVNMIKFKLKLY